MVYDVELQCTIVKGPTQWELIVGLFEEDREPTFTFDKTKDFPPHDCQVCSCSGEFKADILSITRLRDKRDEFILVCEIPYTVGAGFKAEYSTSAGSGQVIETWPCRKEK